MPRTSADEQYNYDGDTLDFDARVSIIGRAEAEGMRKSASDLFAMAESEYYLGTRHYTRTEGRERQADRAVLRAVTFDRMARNIEYRAALDQSGEGQANG
jgi:hypothetical protein